MFSFLALAILCLLNVSAPCSFLLSLYNHQTDFALIPWALLEVNMITLLWILYNLNRNLPAKFSFSHTHSHDLSCCNIYNVFTIHKRLKFLMVQTCLSIIVSINDNILFYTAHFQAIIFITAATLCLSFSKSIMQCTAAGSRYSQHS